MTQSDAGVASLTPTKITPAELDAFSAAQVQGSFQQTSQMAAMGAFNGPVDYVGVKRGDKLIAACYVVYTRSRFGLEGSVWCGPLCDYDNPQVVEAMTEALRRSAKAHHAISVSCWPAAVYRLHDLDGKPTSDPDTTMMDNMARFGWKHGGFTVGYESVVNRWNFVKGLDCIHDEKELLASFSKYRRKNIRIAQDSGLRVRRLERGELSTFVKLCDMSAARQGFKSRDLAYYERLFDTFGDLIEFKVVETHFDEYLDTLQSKLNAASKDKRNLEARATAAGRHGQEGCFRPGNAGKAHRHRRQEDCGAGKDHRRSQWHHRLGRPGHSGGSRRLLLASERGRLPVQRRGRSFHGLLPVFPNPLRGDA